MTISRDFRVIVFVVSLIVAVAAYAYLQYLTTELKGQIDRDFALSGAGTQFVFDCVVNSDNVFRIADDTPMWDFCGCLGTDMGESLDDEDLHLAAFLIRESERTWTRVPPVRFAKTAAERHIVTALEHGTEACWGHLDLRTGR